MIIEHKLIFCLCLMTHIMSIINKLLLALQKEAVLLADINHYFAITLAQFRQLMKTDNPEAFSQICPKNEAIMVNIKYSLIKCSFNLMQERFIFLKFS